MYYTVDMPFGQAIQLYILAINYCFLFFHLYKLLISFFSVNRLIYEAVIFRARFARVTQNSLRDFCLPGDLDGDFAPHSLEQCTLSNMQIGSYKNSCSVIVSITKNQKHFLYKTFPHTILQLAYIYITKLVEEGLKWQDRKKKRN